jgi:hypothetical protein
MSHTSTPPQIHIHASHHPRPYPRPSVASSMPKSQVPQRIMTKLIPQTGRFDQNISTCLSINQQRCVVSSSLSPIPSNEMGEKGKRRSHRATPLRESCLDGDSSLLCLRTARLIRISAHFVPGSGVPLLSGAGARGALMGDNHTSRAEKMLDAGQGAEWRCVEV